MMHVHTVITHEIVFVDDAGRILVMITRAEHANLTSPTETRPPYTKSLAENQSSSDSSTLLSQIPVRFVEKSLRP